jgi:hypothetical protein
MPKIYNEDSNAEASLNFISPSTYLAFNFPSSESQTWLNTNVSQEIFKTFSYFNFNASSLHFASWLVEKTNCDLSLGIPFVFSISENAIGLLSKSTEFREDVIDICNKISEFVLERDLIAVGEISIFQEDETEPKLFITYGIANKQYKEILELWDEVCKQLAKSTSTSSLEKIAVIFDQL